MCALYAVTAQVQYSKQFPSISKLKNQLFSLTKSRPVVLVLQSKVTIFTDFEN